MFILQSVYNYNFSSAQLNCNQLGIDHHSGHCWVANCWVLCSDKYGPISFGLYKSISTDILIYLLIFQHILTAQGSSSSRPEYEAPQRWHLSQDVAVRCFRLNSEVASLIIKLIFLKTEALRQSWHQITIIKEHYRAQSSLSVLVLQPPAPQSDGADISVGLKSSVLSSFIWWRIRVAASPGQTLNPISIRKEFNLNSSDIQSDVVAQYFNVLNHISAWSFSRYKRQLSLQDSNQGRPQLSKQEW